MFHVSLSTRSESTRHDVCCKQEVKGTRRDSVPDSTTRKKSQNKSVLTLALIPTFSPGEKEPSSTLFWLAENRPANYVARYSKSAARVSPSSRSRGREGRGEGENLLTPQSPKDRAQRPGFKNVGQRFQPVSVQRSQRQARRPSYATQQNLSASRSPRYAPLNQI